MSAHKRPVPDLTKGMVIPAKQNYDPKTPPGAPIWPPLRMIETRFTAGHWVLNRSMKIEVQARPTWWERFWMRRLLGWQWVDGPVRS